MKSFLKHFFRGTPDINYVFPAYGLEHIALILICIYGIYFIIKNRDKLTKTNLGKTIKSFLIIGLLLQQAILYTWYGFSGYFSIKESLPLYNCRLAIIFTAFALLTNKNLFRNVSIYWGIIGAILALASPDLDPFIFPHYTGISFFLGHFLLIWGAVYILVIDKYKISRKNLKEVFHFTNIYHLFILVFNMFTNSNYCYLIEPPIFKDIFERLPQTLYTLLVFMFFNLLMLIVYIVAMKVYGKFDKQLETYSY